MLIRVSSVASCAFTRSYACVGSSPAASMSAGSAGSAAEPASLSLSTSEHHSSTRAPASFTNPSRAAAARRMSTLAVEPPRRRRCRALRRRAYVSNGIEGRDNGPIPALLTAATVNSSHVLLGTGRTVASHRSASGVTCTVRNMPSPPSRADMLYAVIALPPMKRGGSQMSSTRSRPM